MGAKQKTPGELLPWRSELLPLLFARCLRWCILDLGTNPDGLDIHEFLDTEGGELAAISTMLDPSERKARITCCHAVNEHAASLDAGSQCTGLLDIARPEIAAQAKLGVVCQFNSMLCITGMNNSGNGTEGLIGEYRHLRGHIGQNGWLVEVAFPLAYTASNQDLSTLLDRLLHLLIERLPQVFAGQRTDLSVILQWITDLQSGCVGNKFLLKSLRNRLHHDKALGSDAALTIILEAGCDSYLCSLIQVGILQND